MPRIEIKIQPGCIRCGLCEARVPEVFRVLDRGSVVRRESRAQWEMLRKQILATARDCPV